MFVETHGDAEIEFTGAYRTISAEQGGPTGCTAVEHIDERQGRQAQLGNQGIGFACCVRSAVRNLHVRPAEIRIGKRCAHCELTLLKSAEGIGATERMDTDADYENVS